MSTTDDRELAAASGAYALHALEGQEGRDFEALLERSPGLRGEVTELTDTAVELGLAVPAEVPPAALRASILAAIASTPQLAPAPGTEDVSDPEPTLAPVIPLAWYRRPVGALTATAAAVLLAAGAAVGGGIVQSSASAAEVSAIASAPDAEHATVKLSDGGVARVVWSHRLGRSGVELTDAPALDINRTYQLWYIDGSGARSAGVVADSSDVMLAGSMHPGDTIGITVEPAGGSAKPSTAPIMTVATS